MKKLIVVAVLIYNLTSFLLAADKPLLEAVQQLQEFKQYVHDTMNENCYPTAREERAIHLVKQHLMPYETTLEREISHTDNAYLAMLKLAFLYEITNEKKLAEYWYVGAADQNNPLALFECGCFYEKIGNNKEAQECYEKLLNKGFAYAAIKMGRLLERHEELEAALSWYQKAAPESEYARFKVGLIQEYLGNYTDAKDSFKDAAQRGHVQSMWKCGNYAEREDDVDSMLCWYKFAGKNGSAEAYCRIGKYYQAQGDDNSAEKYFIFAAQMGSTVAMHELDIIHIKKNFSPGDPHAMVLFGMLNERQGNYELALQCYSFALRRGHFAVSEHIGRVKRILQEFQSQQMMRTIWADRQS